MDQPDIDLPEAAEDRSPRGVDVSAGVGGLAQLISKLDRRLNDMEKFLQVLVLLVAQRTDPTHLTVEAAARAIGVSAKTIRRRIAAGTLTLETIPGTRRTGVPIDQLYDGWWVPLSLARKLINEERQELAQLKKRNR